MTTTIEIDVEVEYEYHPEIHPYLSGPPEYCYPGESESAEIVSVTFAGKEISDDLTMKQIEDIEAACIEHAKESRE